MYLRGLAGAKDGVDVQQERYWAAAFTSPRQKTLIGLCLLILLVPKNELDVAVAFTE